MKTFNLIICLGLFATSAIAGPPTWTAKTDFPGTARYAAAAFSIGNIGYIGTGFDNGGGSGNTSDFWAYNTVTELWSQVANFGGGPIRNNIAFVINGKGYVGTGENTTSVYEYTPYDGMTGNTWTLKASFAGVSSAQGVAFTINNIGYFRTGDQTAMQNRTSFWSFDPTVGGNGTWTQMNDLGSGMMTGGIVSRSAAGFSIGNYGYLGTGLDAGGTVKIDFYRYDPMGNVWTSRTNFGGSARTNSVGLSTSSKGYIGLGFHGSNDFWEYDPTADTWTGLSVSYPGGTQAQAVGFTVGNNLYVGTGIWSGPPYSKEFYKYNPTGEAVLPVELTTITATADMPNEQVNVNWQTATEKESAYFAIERQSKTSSPFEEIGRIKGAGNSDKTLIYKFIDEKPVYGVSYYRLRLADIDGKTTYSKAVSVSYKGGAKIKVFPTFTEGYVTIEKGDKRIDDVYVWNASGQLMLQSKQAQLDISALPRGLYLVQVKVGGETFVQKITKQ